MQQLCVREVLDRGQSPRKLERGERPSASQSGEVIAVLVSTDASWQMAVNVTALSYLEKVLKNFERGVYSAVTLYSLSTETVDEIAELGEAGRADMAGNPVRDPGRKV